jgi:hypothetical protein
MLSFRSILYFLKLIPKNHQKLIPRTYLLQPSKINGNLLRISVQQNRTFVTEKNENTKIIDLKTEKVVSKPEKEPFSKRFMLFLVNLQRNFYVYLLFYFILLFLTNRKTNFVQKKEIFFVFINCLIFWSCFVGLFLVDVWYFYFFCFFKFICFCVLNDRKFEKKIMIK